jgi:alpha-tubulin suppressor-like RCC1 family protein
MNGQVIFLSAGSATITARTAFRTALITITAAERRLLVMDAGADYTCGYTALGRGYCWGLSDDGRTAAAADSLCFPGPSPCILPPKRMNRPDLVFTTISAGGNFGCGVAADQMLYCWGNDEFGQIGNGQDGAGATPSLATVKTHRFTTVTAGALHACALNLVGTAYCWGNDGSGQLGDNTTVNSSTPIPVADTTLSFRAISAGDHHTCALTTSGAAYCWGDNASGQLGNGTQLMSLKPALVSGGLTFVAISAGRSHTCGIDTAANVHCWGDNFDAQLGQGTAGGIQVVPTLVTGGGGYTAISTGWNHTCGIALGAVRCWGGSEFGEVGDGSELSHIVVVPTTVAGLTASSISVGVNHSCAITTAGVAMCWGSNRFGTLGNEYQAAVRATPQVVARPR